MKRLTHSVKPIRGINHDDLRGGKLISRFQLPGKARRINPHDSPNTVKLIYLCRGNKISGIDEAEAINLSALLRRMPSGDCQKRMLLMARFTAYGRNGLLSIADLAPVDMAFSCP